MAASDDDDESDEDIREELIQARDKLSGQLDALARTSGRDWTPDFDNLKASLTDELEQVEAELAKYSGEPAPTQDSDPDADKQEPDPESEPEPASEPEDAGDPEAAPAVSAPIQFHTDAPDGPPDGGQFWTFAGMGIVALLALALLLRIFSMLWAHLMGHPTG